ncbi:hypothetical protein KAR91_48095, partial [Candidatus Pacearchaeota archaeon]|nr:hypothetical protein [Candidatus Pacearchaeota archaeon]
MINMILALLSTLLIVGCSALPKQILDPEIYYKRDMILTVDGFQGEGTLVVPDRKKHSFHVQARGHLDMFSLQTCHREWTKERAWNVKVKSGLFGWGREIKKDQIKFSLMRNTLERKDYCLIELGGYEKKQGRHSWAIIDVQSSEYELP